MRVLLVEDEVRLADNLAAALRDGPGFAVDWAADGEAGDDCARNRVYDLIILDLMLPKLDGQSVLRRLRAREDPTPVLILTAKEGKNTIVELLNSGADDYLAKPFDLGELIARAKALIRRRKGAAHPTLSALGITLNTLEQTVRRGNALVELLEHLYDYNWEHHSNVIEAHVSNLRKKLDAALPDAEPVIETMRGRGYRMAVELDQDLNPPQEKP